MWCEAVALADTRNETTLVKLGDLKGEKMLLLPIDPVHDLNEPLFHGGDSL
ncbi:MAG: hypothetical protein ACAI34_25395 [Verrucomicrobium sp.]